MTTTTTTEQSYKGSNKMFYTFLGWFAHTSTAYNLQMAHCWRFINAQVGKKRQYTYEYLGKEITETLTLLRLESVEDDILCVYKTRTGKKEWRESIVGSCFHKHWKLANQKAGKYIEC